MVQIAAGKYHTCARISNGTILCWGHNGYYELGTGNNTAHLLPVQVRSGNNAGILTGEVSVSVGQYHSCAVHSDGSARCWGLGQFGLLGRGDQKASDLPVRVKCVSGAGLPGQRCFRLRGSRAHLRPAEEQDGQLLGLRTAWASSATAPHSPGCARFSSGTRSATLRW